jgi:hypothetical protein
MEREKKQKRKTDDFLIYIPTERKGKSKEEKILSPNGYIKEFRDD